MTGAASRPPVVLVRGSGDVASALAHRLFRAGYAVVLHDIPQPAASRRGMAFADALFDGEASVEGVTAVRVDGLDTLAVALTAPERPAGIPVVADGPGADLAAVLQAVLPVVLVDARMRKRAVPERQRGLAPLVVGLGPGFVAGDGPEANVDVAVETSWEDLGRVIERGPTLPLAGEPRALGGHTRDRYVYAPVAGTFRTTLTIGAVVEQGQEVARVGDTPLRVPLAGVLRGLTHDGVPVTVGTKVIEVDPRGPDGAVRGIGERPGRIAEGVLRAVKDWTKRTASSRLEGQGMGGPSRAVRAQPLRSRPR